MPIILIPKIRLGDKISYLYVLFNRQYLIHMKYTAFLRMDWHQIQQSSSYLMQLKQLKLCFWTGKVQ